MKRVHICTQPGCPQYAPCPIHSRPADAPWSQDRKHDEHMRLRRYIVKTRGPACERCGQQALDPTGKGLAMHHIRPGNKPTDVILLCGKCHKRLDPHAR